MQWTLCLSCRHEAPCRKASSGRLLLHKSNLCCEWLNCNMLMTEVILAQKRPRWVQVAATRNLLLVHCNMLMTEATMAQRRSMWGAGRCHKEFAAEADREQTATGAPAGRKPCGCGVGLGAAQRAHSCHASPPAGICRPGSP